MAQGTVEVKLGPLSFSGEGDEKWLSGELERILEKAPAILQIAPTNGGSGNGADSEVTGGGARKATKVTLVAFLKSANVGTRQTKIFLATAEWLHSQGHERLTTNDVTKALSDNHQKKLTNPAQCLNNNATRGYCQKEGKQFYVTPEGRTSLGTSSAE